MALVYCYTNKINNKKYIGITTRPMIEREKSHLYEAYNQNSTTYNYPFKKAIRKYGIDGFDLEILHEDIDKSEAIELERYYIEHYKTYYKYLNSNGYNATIGGEFIAQPKSRVFEINIVDNFKITNIFNSMKDAERSVGKRLTNFNQRKKDYASSVEYIYIYENEYNKETIEYEVYNKLKNPVVQLSLDGDFIRSWVSLKEASKNTGATNISLCLTGDRIKSGGYRWVRFKDYVQNLYSLKEAKDMKIQYVAIDFDGEYKGIFTGLEDIERRTKATSSAVSNAVRGKASSRHSGGYIWFTKEEYQSLSEQDIEDILKQHAFLDNRVIATKDGEIKYFDNKVQCEKFFNLRSVTIKSRIDNQERINGWLLNNRNKYRFVNKEEKIRQEDKPLSNNKGGYKNIYYSKDKKKYNIKKKHGDKTYSKYAKTLEEAIEIRDNLYKELGLIS